MSRAEKEEGQYMIRTIERAKTHYDVFQLPDDADAKTIRTTMRDMLRKIHPDKCGNAGLEATKRVNEAYDVLKDPDSRAAYDLELREQREQREPPKKPKAKPKAKPAAKPKAAPKPRAPPKARSASPKRAAPEDDDEPAPKPKRGRKAEAEAPSPAPAAAPAAAPRPYMGSCTCKVLTQSNWPLSCKARLAQHCNAGDVGPHECSCVDARQTWDGTVACRGDDHLCVCNTHAESMGAAFSSIGACRAATHECSCAGMGPLSCRATDAAHVCTCEASPHNCKAQARKHKCRCVETKNPGICRATRHACSCKETGKPASCLAATHDCTCPNHAGGWGRGTANCRADDHECTCLAGGVKTCRGGDDVVHACTCEALVKGAWLDSRSHTAPCKAPDAAHVCVCGPQAHPYYEYCRSVRGAVPRLAQAPPPRAPPPPRATRAPRAPRRGRGSRPSDPQYVPDSDEDYDDDE
ncbi:unnamed protein product [Pelagomonas calceolata]|uniref:J domain-containing protein n=3 Tax=Pelagomonas calceolata TaxID=35677 RepID=A0A8J2SGS0_9STRA|nr:unnamed protein product [Pelagomonas calceolata]